MMSKFLSAAAAVSLVMAPVAAQANTRPSVPGTVASSVDSGLVSRVSSSVQSENELVGKSLWLLLVLIFGVGGAIALISGGDSNKSPGSA